MANPFPGMNPYLESPDFWPQVHHLLISSIEANTIMPATIDKPKNPTIAKIRTMQSIEFFS